MRLGVLDIGSNTVHLLLVDAHPGARPNAYADHKQQLSLIRHLDDQGAITTEGVDKLLLFIREAVSFAQRNGAEDMIAFCTSAIRESANGPEVLAKVTDETGVHLAELSGDQEAAMTYFAVRRWQGWHVEHLLNFDIGGGSFEIAYGTDELPSRAVSVPLGAARLTREFLSSDPPKGKQLRKLSGHIEAVLDDTLGHLGDSIQMPEHTVVTGTSKTFRSLARVAGAAPSSEGPFVTRTLKRKDLKYWIGKMSKMTVDQRAQLPGVSEIRAPQVLAGGMVAHAAMKYFGVKRLVICPWALREGLMMGRLDALLMEGVVGRDLDPWVGSLNLSSGAETPGFSLGVVSA
ncbi:MULTISPECIES: Ppx/GppA family phosphatase [Auritidibacter]|uniref:Ppx/GppA family phosphatase n=1 Tax=Auritidibacter ignavus TaxID=678932 RepID=A0AAJ6AGN0_9MICC|nr:MULTISPECIES: Ppx/GppA family phosphatase [Auritidibacter]PXA78048.1 exopolyphosphatase [Auritidibacter sp. NML120779]AXR74903.1 Ppx/GppA family phosphatase [Auritidibacter sp. NML130574]NIH71325.1 exopolyphosphatase/guanosine-5'-triphosphate,3'-diphosphate pyrophosphatase [Auritidibacter ignavus]PXA78256.1 exopolyphosphatase [Auritidibacter sp. NML100628]PXA81021.1 exopolyphosphatase [Auritidibacter sp. NML120636]